jgi:hypothetical protein
VRGDIVRRNVEKGDEEVNRDEILERKPGRELDALVAEKVMGLPQPYLSPFNGEWVIKHEEKWKPIERLQNYSTDISAAWEVVEKFESYKLSKLPDGDVRIKYGGQYQCFINANKNCGYGSTAPEAICKAALLAVLEVNVD